MRKILAAAGNTLRLLTRDRAGLLVLFVMPAVLVVVITLVQENILELSGQRETEILLFDQDKGAFAKAIRTYLQSSRLKIREWDASQGSTSDLRRLLANGKFQAGIIIATGTSDRLQQGVAHLFTQNRDRSVAASAGPTSLDVLFDPAAMAGYRAGILARVQIAAQAAEMELKVTALSTVLAGKIGEPRPAGTPGLISGSGLQEAFSQALVNIREQPSAPGTPVFETLANPVDQNVPAWALFGMFFTAIPIAGALLEERRSKISIRLACLPVSSLQLLTGKVMAYLGVCLCQFLLIALIGVYLFPCLGLPSFTLPANAAVLLPVVCACGLAACGFGTFLGTVCRSYEQASTLGATSVVVAAALGGVMVPVYAMPLLMQKISILSPLNWGLNAFSDLLVRGHSFSAILGDLGRLLLFSAVMILIAWKWSYRRNL